MIVTLTGPSGSGKTTVCRTLASRARSQGLSVAGLLTTPRVSPAGLHGLDVVDLATGERVALAERGARTDGPATGHWSFHREGIEWGVGRLRGSGGADLLIVDELGPLELLRGEGWADAIGALRAGRHRLAVAVVRPDLVERLLALLEGHSSRQLVVGPGTRDTLPDAIIGMLAGGP